MGLAKVRVRSYHGAVVVEVIRDQLGGQEELKNIKIVKKSDYGILFFSAAAAAAGRASQPRKLKRAARMQ